MVEEKVKIVAEMVDNVTGKAKRIQKTIQTFNKRIKTTTKQYDISAGGQTRLTRTTKSVKDTTARYNAQQEKQNAINKKATERALALGRQNKFLREQSERMGVTTEGVRKSMSAVDLEFDKTGGVVGKAGQNIKVTNGLMDRGRRISKGFQFGWLSVMFAGMALNRVFGGMIKSQMQLFGIMDVFSGVLTMVMLPVMTLLLPIFLRVAEFFMNLPDSVKMVIGVFIILGAIFGLLLLVVGQVMLAVGGFALLMTGPWGTVIIGAITAVVGALGWVLLIVAAIIAIGIAMYFAWKENFMGMKDIVDVFIESVKAVFGGLFNVLKGLIKFFVALFKGDFEGVKEAVVMIFKGLVQILTGLIMALVTAIAGIIVGIVRAFWGIIQVIWGYWKWIYHKLVGGSLIPDLVNAIIWWFWKLPVAILNALKSILTNVYNWGADFVKNIGEGIKSMASKFKDALLSIFPSWARNSIWAGGTMVIEIIKNITERIKKAFGGSTESAGDFILRPGGDLIKTDPRDTIMGFKGKGPSSSGSEITINNYNTFNVSDKAEMEKMLNANNSKLTEEVKRLIGI